MRLLASYFFILVGLFFPSLASAITLTSSAFANNGVIPNEFTYSSESQCSGGNLSPPLTIGEIPAGVLSLALTVLDPDGGDWVHWKAWNIPANTTSLPENVSRTASFNQAANDFGTVGYGGPCPPSPNHRYVFTLYALNRTFATEPSLAQLQGAALATATLTGVRSPSDNVSASQALAARVFAYGEENYPTIFTGSATAGQYLQYNYRYYQASGNYLAMDTAGVIYILGPYTGNVITSVGPVDSLLSYITAWEATAVPYAITVQDVSGNCTLYSSSFAGVLTPTGQANRYTTVFVGGTAMSLTVPGSNALNFSYAEGGGTSSEQMQLTFDAQTRSIAGSSDWTHTNGCSGHSTISGSW